MSTKKPISNFDCSIIQDKLLETLARSPETAPYVQHRVEEIVISIMERETVKELVEIVEQMEGKIGQIEEQNDRLRESIQGRQQYEEKLKLKLRQSQQNIKKYETKLLQQQSQTKALSQTQSNLQTAQSNLNSLTSENQSLSKKILTFQSQIQSQTTALDQLQSQLNKKQQQVKYLQQQMEKNKKMYKDTKIVQIKMRKEMEKYIVEKGEILGECAKVKEELRLEKLHRENQRKALQAKCMKFQSGLVSMRKGLKKMLPLQILIKSLKQQFRQLTSFFNLNLSKLSSQLQSSFPKLVQKIDQHFHSQLQPLLSHFSKLQTANKFLRQELKNKEEIIQKMQKIQKIQNIGHKQMQRELKGKKQETERLRKQLKKNYEENQVRLCGIQGGYRKILGDLRTGF